MTPPTQAPPRPRQVPRSPRPEPYRRPTAAPSYRTASPPPPPHARPRQRPPARRAPIRRVRPGNPAGRARWLLLLVVLSLIAVTVRMVQLQVLSPETYVARGLAQRMRTIPVAAERGSVFDRNGNELAMSVRQSTVFADPRLVEDPVATAARLAPVLSVDQAILEQKLRQDGAFVYLARKVDDEVAAAVAELDLPGIAMLDESERFRPNGDLAMSILGSVDIDNNGVSGVELLFEDAMHGTPGELLLEQGPDGRTIASGQRHLTPASPGDDLVLTIDRSLQYEVERALAEQIVATNAEGGTAVVMEPSTGEILAMANLRNGEEGPRPTLDNMAVTSVFEPGSVNKVITMAGALEEGIVAPDTVLTVPDRLPVSVHTFSDHDPHPPTEWNINDIITVSSNIGTIMVAQELGAERVDKYLRQFGLGESTGLGFPNESRGIMLEPDGWHGTDIGSVPIGHGISVTALQMLGVYNTFANGGVFVPPRIVRATVDEDGEEHLVDPVEGRRVVSERTAKQITTMLANAVAVGTGTNAQIDGYTVAGKTGTARKPLTDARGYESGAYLSSFAGFVPAEAPALSAIVVLDEPHPYYAGLVSAPVFSRISKYALRQFRIPPPPAAIATETAPPEQAPGVAVRD
jgi:cell division protein FtsI (penicillin-binding protein 3)